MRPTLDAFLLSTALVSWGNECPLPNNGKINSVFRSIQDDGTVQVNNTCDAQGAPVNMVGSAGPANPPYGAAGVFRVQVPGQPGPDCPGPNYVVRGARAAFQGETKPEVESEPAC